MQHQKHTTVPQHSVPLPDAITSRHNPFDLSSRQTQSSIVPKRKYSHDSNEDYRQLCDIISYYLKLDTCVSLKLSTYMPEYIFNFGICSVREIVLANTIKHKIIENVDENLIKFILKTHPDDDFKLDIYILDEKYWNVSIKYSRSKLQFTVSFSLISS